MKILIVEDEPFIAETCRVFLKNKGHSVTTASDGQSGMYCYKRSLDDGDPFDLVITDYRMPIKDGAQVIREIFALKPDQKIILATAYSIEFSREAPIQKDKVPILQKPFSFEDLQKLIENQGGTAAVKPVELEKVSGLIMLKKAELEKCTDGHQLEQLHNELQALECLHRQAVKHASTS